MNVEPFLQRIRETFPQIHIGDVRVPVQGMDHVAIIVDNQWVFRFPNRQEYFATFFSEVRLLRYLQSKISVPIPHYTLVTEDQSFGGYALIEGEECTAEIFAKLSKSSQKALSAELSQFLTELHSVSTEEVTTFLVQKADYRNDLKELHNDYQAILSKHITKEEQKACNQFFVEYSEMISRATSTLIHGDYNWWHILINPSNGALNGIIDFGDCCLGDPAADFGGMWVYGHEFVESVYRQYRGPNDDQLMERSLLHFKKLGMSELLHALKGEFGSVSDAYILFQRALSAKLPS